MKHTTFKKIAARVGILMLAVLLLSIPFAPSAAAEGAPPVTTTAPSDTEASLPSDTEASLSPTGEEPIEKTVAGAIADFLREESAGLLSGATLLFTLIVSLGFRKRIIPSLLDTLGTLVGKSREAVGAMIEGQKAEHAEFISLLDRVEAMLAEAQSAKSAAEAAAAALSKDGESKDTLQKALAEQSDLLYELLMSANLPQYQKDRIGAQHARVKAALSGDRHD